MLIHIKGCYTILGRIYSGSKERVLRFTVTLEGKSPVVVNIIPDENGVESFHQSEVSKQTWDILHTDIYDARKLPAKLRAEVSEITSGISKATRHVLYLIKYCLNHIELNENLFSVKGTYWSEDKTEWKELPRTLVIISDISHRINLNERTAKAIQKCITDGFEPFLALRHLHRARAGDNPRYKWIDATIAAELAIKEFLIRLGQGLEPLLLELPSPPLHKLYGSVLESYAKERSPKLKKLAEGEKVRNRLVHRPRDIHIDAKQANRYVHDVEVAIYHLLTLLYPKDPIVKRFYRPRAVLT